MSAQFGIPGCGQREIKCLAGIIFQRAFAVQLVLFCTCLPDVAGVCGSTGLWSAVSLTFMRDNHLRGNHRAHHHSAGALNYDNYCCSIAASTVLLFFIFHCSLVRHKPNLRRLRGWGWGWGRGAGDGILLGSFGLMAELQLANVRFLINLKKKSI